VVAAVVLDRLLEGVGADGEGHPSVVARTYPS
jgi:hypothetical protein